MPANVPQICNNLRSLAGALGEDQSQVSMGDIDLIKVTADEFELTYINLTEVVGYLMTQAKRDQLNAGGGKLYHPPELKAALVQLGRHKEIAK